MDWNAPTWWWLAAGALVAAELATGTCYLLRLARRCAAGALGEAAGTLLLQAPRAMRASRAGEIFFKVFMGGFHRKE